MSARSQVFFGSAMTVLVLAVASCAATGTDGAEVSKRSDTRAPQESTDPSEQSPSGRVRIEGIPDDWTPEPLEWAPCTAVSVAGDCATLTVPLDWSDPDGDTIQLGLGRISATGDRIGSLLMNPGGPGASGLEFLGYELFGPPVSERFDLVSWDPRGVGESTPLSCGDAQDMLRLDPDPDTPDEQVELEAAAAAISTDCERTDSAMLAEIGTWNVARDMEAIRRALGDEPLNYIGFSYGTHIGQAYAELFPTMIRTMVLDGVVDPSLGFEEFLLGQTRAFDASFHENAEACASEGRQECGVDDLVEAYDEVLRRVELEPIGSGADRIGPAELGTAAVMTTYAADGWRRLGPALAAALDGDGSGIRRLADAYFDFGSYAAYAGVVCTDSPPPEDEAAFRAFADAAREISPRFGGGVANEMLPCATWPADASGPPAPLSAAGAPPILVIGNTGDTATPYENAVTVADTLSSGVLVTAGIGGHTAYGSNPCVTDVVNDYLIQLIVPETDPRCT